MAVLQEIDRNIDDICDRIFLAFYRISPLVPFLVVDLICFVGDIGYCNCLFVCFFLEI